MPLFDKYDEYVEKLLIAQYEVSEIIEHLLTRGEVREDFLKFQVFNQYNYLVYHKGFIYDTHTDYQSGQLDIIITHNSVRTRPLGDHAMVNANDVKMVIEVKSNAQSSDIRDFNMKAEEIKSLASGNHIKFGLFCYNYIIQEKNMLRKFGYKYDYETDAYDFDYSLEQKYPNLDFVTALDCINDEGGKDFFIIKDNTGNFVLYKQKPVSKFFFDLFNQV